MHNIIEKTNHMVIFIRPEKRRIDIYLLNKSIHMQLTYLHKCETKLSKISMLIWE